MVADPSGREIETLEAQLASFSALQLFFHFNTFSSGFTNQVADPRLHLPEKLVGHKIREIWPRSPKNTRRRIRDYICQASEMREGRN